jgi:hypothetical protein
LDERDQNNQTHLWSHCNFKRHIFLSEKKMAGTYMPGEWCWSQTQAYYRQLREIVDAKGAGDPKALDGDETFDDGTSMAHWAISRIINEPERQTKRAALLPLKLRQMIEAGHPLTYSIPVPPVDKRRRQTDPSAIGTVATHTVRKGKHVMFQATQLTPLAVEPIVREKDPSEYVQKVCVEGCSITDIRICKKILKLGQGITPQSILPTGQTAAQFAIIYVYNEGIRRLNRKRKSPDANNL